MQDDLRDRQLLERHLSGDGTALTRILEAYEGPLLRFARPLAGSDDLAQDAVQEAFLRFLRQGARMREVRSLASWFLQVTRNLCLDMHRQEARMDRKHEAAVREAPLAVAPADAPLVSAEVIEQVRRAVDRLPEPQREVVRLKLWEGLSYRQIAAKLGMSLSNVSRNLGTAVQVVAGELRSEGILG